MKIKITENRLRQIIRECINEQISLLSEAVPVKQIKMPNFQKFKEYNVGDYKLCIYKFSERKYDVYKEWFSVMVYNRRGTDVTDRFVRPSRDLSWNEANAVLKRLLEELNNVSPEGLYKLVDGFLRHRGCNVIESHIQDVYEDFVRAYFYIEKEEGLDIDNILFALKNIGCKAKRNSDKRLLGHDCYHIAIMMPLRKNI